MRIVTGLILMVFLASVPNAHALAKRPKAAVPAEAAAENTSNLSVQPQANVSRLKSTQNSLVEIWGKFTGTLFTFTHLTLRKLDIT